MSESLPSAEKGLLRYVPGTLLRDKAGCYWMVRDDGQTAAGTNGGVMVDLRRGEPVFSPAPDPVGAVFAAEEEALSRHQRGECHLYEWSCSYCEGEATTCWRGECRARCFYPDACSHLHADPCPSCGMRVLQCTCVTPPTAAQGGTS